MIAQSAKASKDKKAEGPTRLTNPVIEAARERRRLAQEILAKVRTGILPFPVHHAYAGTMTHYRVCSSTDSI